MDYRIVCTTQRPANQPPTHAHIVAVGTGTDPDKASKPWTLRQVIDAIDSGNDRFYTKGQYSGVIAQVHKVACPSCGHYIIRSVGDVVKDNNLDSLRACRTFS